MDSLRREKVIAGTLIMVAGELTTLPEDGVRRVLRTAGRASCTVLKNTLLRFEERTTPAKNPAAR